MKSLLILITLVTLISCEQQDVVDQIQNTDGPVSLGVITNQLEGTYDLGCKQVNYAKGDEARLTLVIDENGSTIFEDIFVASGLPCSNNNNIIFTLEHDVDATVEYISQINASNLQENVYHLVIDVLSTSIETKHVVMNNLVCGSVTFTQLDSYDITGEGCSFDKTGESNLLISEDDVNNLEFEEINAEGLKGWSVFNIIL